MSTGTGLEWAKSQKNTSQSETTQLDGQSLTVPDVVKVARGKCSADYSQPEKLEILQKMNASVAVLNDHLSRGKQIYGVTTGFGGSAGSRTNHLESLQKSLLQFLTSGILSKADIGKAGPASHDQSTEAMPTSWVRGSMLTRLNSLVRGHSGVRPEIADALLAFLRKEITPVVPLRGSISASGDLTPLAYIAAALAGRPDIYVTAATGNPMPASQALKEEGLKPITLQAKEGLGLVNGTAVSAAVASLVIHDAEYLTYLAHLLTAMAVEALQGSTTSFDPFISAVRPHAGQTASARYIRGFLAGSKLARPSNTNEEPAATAAGPHRLHQDRYALRTSPQWLGPLLEDLALAHKQISTELNSTTDNPLIDTATSTILSGGNFQALSLTSAMEKTRSSLQLIGRLLFAQTSELINPATNGGLPPNLCADDPSLSFTAKGLDINMAAYMSELSVLGNSVANHVVSAEMHNQSVNSLALVSARQTSEAVTVLSQMCAVAVWVGVQGVDLQLRQQQQEEGTGEWLGNGTRRLYEFVRGDLGVQMHRGLVEADEEGCEGIGSQVSRIYEAMRDGRVADVVADAILEVEAENDGGVEGQVGFC